MEANDKKPLYLYNPPKYTFPKKNYQYAVGIVLPTKDRPLFLKRALKSIIHQTYKNWQLIIVNDGGDTESLEKNLFIYQAVLENRLTVINNPTSQGMAAAANIGIKASSSEFIIVHNDNDTWHPKFLQETVSFLQDPNNIDCGSVITHTIKVQEELRDDEIIEKQRIDYNSTIYHNARIDLFKLLMSNAIHFSSLLMREQVFEKVGYFNEALPVSGDWEFAIRLALQFEIGLVPKHLTFYHQIINQKANKNFEDTNPDLINKTETLIRNSNLRRMLNSKDTEHLIGICQALGHHFYVSSNTPLQLIPWINHTVSTPLTNDMKLVQKQIIDIKNVLNILTEKLSYLPIRQIAT